MGTEDGLDDFGVGRVGLDLFAELGDVLVEGAAVRGVRIGKELGGWLIVVMRLCI